MLLYILIQNFCIINYIFLTKMPFMYCCRLEFLFSLKISCWNFSKQIENNKKIFSHIYIFEIILIPHYHANNTRLLKLPPSPSFHHSSSLLLLFSCITWSSTSIISSSWKSAPIPKLLRVSQILSSNFGFITIFISFFTISWFKRLCSSSRENFEGWKNNPQWQM